MQQILAFMRKEFLLLVQKPGIWIVVFVVPFLFIWIIQAVFGSSGTPVVTIFAVNEDQTKEAGQVMDALRNSDNLKIEVLKTRDEADKRVGAGERMAAIVIPEGFAKDLTTPSGARIVVIIDPAHSEQASIVTGLVNTALGPIMVDAEVSRGVEAGINQVMSLVEAGTPTPGAVDQTATPGLDGGAASSTPGPDTGFDLTTTPTAEVGSIPGLDTGIGTDQGAGTNAGSADLTSLKKFFTAALKGVVSSQVQEALNDPQVKLDTQPVTAGDANGAQAHRPSLLDSLVPGYSLMFVFFLVGNLALTLIDERETGTLRRLLIAPVPRSRILFGKMLPYYLIAVVQLIAVLMFSKLIFNIDLGNDPGRSVLALGVLVLTSALSVVTLGILVAAFARSMTQADGLATVLVLAMAVVSGAMFPSISIPGLQTITPHYWALQGFLNVISRGQGMEGVLRPAGMLLTMSAVFFTIGSIRFRFE